MRCRPGVAWAWHFAAAGDRVRMRSCRTLLHDTVVHVAPTAEWQRVLLTECLLVTTSNTDGIKQVDTQHACRLWCKVVTPIERQLCSDNIHTHGTHLAVQLHAAIILPGIILPGRGTLRIDGCRRFFRHALRHT